MDVEEGLVAEAGVVVGATLFPLATVCSWDCYQRRTPSDLLSFTVQRLTVGANPALMPAPLVSRDDEVAIRVCRCDAG